MNDKEIRNIIKESVLSPSDHFSDDLMKKVYAESFAIKKIRMAIVLLGLGCLICFLLLVMITFPQFRILGYLIDISPVFIQIPGIIFILYEISQIFELRKNLGIARKNNKVQHSGSMN